LDAIAIKPLDLRPRELTSRVLCAVIFKQFSDSIRVQKEHVGVPNLELIIQAALDIGRRKGFHSTTTRDMAEASGLSMGAIYNYVESKETLLRMILAGVDYAVENAIVPFDLGEQENPTKRLHGLIRRHIEVSDILQRWFAFAFLEVKAFDKSARETVLQSEMRNEKLLADAIAEGIERGIFIDLPPLTVAGMIMPLIQDWYIKRWKFHKRGITGATYVESVIGFVDRAIVRPL
jgi:TetR/AcrR family transcriptional regulator, cholesterol catabolism regulator